MIEIDVPGRGRLALEHLLLDYNGTLAVDGRPVPGCFERLEELSKSLKVHVLTADTFGTAASFCSRPFIDFHVIPENRQDQAKRDFLLKLGRESTVAVGNGYNDHLMIEAAALGMLVILAEGAHVESLTRADVVFTGILDALDALLHPRRLVATLRA